MQDYGDAEDLIWKLFERRTIQREDLAAIFKAVQVDNVKLVSFWVRGQPEPDVLGGTIRGDPQAIGEVVGQLAQATDLPVEIAVRVYPYNQGADVHFGSPCLLIWGNGQPSLDAISEAE
jgi:hypothetical protein